MNWFLGEPVAAESLLQSGIPLLEAIAALVAIVAICMCVVAALHVIMEVRASSQPTNQPASPAEPKHARSPRRLPLALASHGRRQTSS